MPEKITRKDFIQNTGKAFLEQLQVLLQLLFYLDQHQVTKLQKFRSNTKCWILKKSENSLMIPNIKWVADTPALME